MQTSLPTIHTSPVSLGANHGYRFEGDVAFLNADLAFDASGSPVADRYALQLWACDAPYQGGPLHGIKVAEAALPSVTGHLEANAPAQLPPGQRDYAMVLVLAANGQVHDFSNYPARQVFAGPQLTGSVGYRFEDNEVVLQASVRNQRSAPNLSGSLALELWALAEPYQGGAPDGTLMAQVGFGSLPGDSESTLELRGTRKQPPAGEWQLALVLREWTGAGYQTRDYCNFPVSYRAEPAVRLVRPPVAVREEPTVVVREEPKAQPKLEAVKAEPAKVEPAKMEPAKVEPAKVEPAKAESLHVEPPKNALKSLARVSISTATVEELATVKGLNLKLAQAIVRARPYTSLDELTRVRGIGTKMLQSLRGLLTL